MRTSARGASVIAAVLSVSVVVASGLAGTPQTAASVSFLETFDGAPSAPMPWRPANWDVTVHSRDGTTVTALESMHAGHGPDCVPPPATHLISNYEDAVFQCRDHVMTAIKATGYGVIYVTPNQLVDFSAGEAVIRFDVSTLRTSLRDWIDLVITPFNENVQLVGDVGDVDLNGAPRNAVRVRMDQFSQFTIFRGKVTRNFNEATIGSNDSLHLERILTPSATVRTTFELRLSRNHMKFGIPSLNAWWVDDSFPDLSWTSGVLQIGHHSYTPDKDCATMRPPGISATGCTANTWHWDNVGISPAVPFTILHPDRQTVTAATSNQLNFSGAAPEGARLRFTALGTNHTLSYDGGRTWQAAQLQSFEQLGGDEHFRSYWTPIPAGTQSVQFRANNWYGGVWRIRNVAIWASQAPSAVAPAQTVRPIVSQPAASTPAPPVPPVPSGQVAAIPGTPPVAQPAITGTAVQPGFHSAWVDQSAYPRIAPGEFSAITVRFRNTGTETWQSGVAGRHVNLGVVGDSITFAELGMAAGWLSPNRPTTTAESQVQPGRIGTFTFPIRAAATPGVYRLDLALVIEGVTWLEDQGVYLIVTSDHGYHSAWVGQTPWPVLRPGESSAPITITFRNSGTQAWTRGMTGREVDLGVVGDDRSWSPLGIGWPGPDRAAIQTESFVPPGAVGSFTFRVTAPESPGEYALPLRLVVDGVTWLDDQGVFVLISVTP